MRGTFHILRADGDEIHGVSDKPLELEWMQSTIGGYLQAIPQFNKYINHPCVAFAD